MDDLKHTRKKIRKLKRRLKNLYPEYKQLSITKNDNDKLNKLIDKISKIEYKYVKYLKKQ